MRRPISPAVAVIIVVVVLVLIGIGIWWSQRPSASPPVVTTPPESDIPSPVRPAR